MPILTLNTSKNGINADKKLGKLLSKWLDSSQSNNPLCFLDIKYAKSLIENIKQANSNNQFLASNELEKIWPRLITEALAHIKRKDSRECPNPRAEARAHSFIHEESLGAEKLKKVLDSFSEFEGILYGASPDKYRDHIGHVFRVWLVGCEIIQKQLKDLIIFDYNDTIKKSIETAEWYAMWTIVALCHDIGYPLASIEIINNHAKQSLEKMGLVHGSSLQFGFHTHTLPLHKAIIHIMSSSVKDIKNKKIQEISKGQDKERYLTYLQNKYYLKYLQSFDSMRHGIISSILLAQASVFFLEIDYCYTPYKLLKEEDTKQFFLRREILRAMADHTCLDIYHLKYNTLSFLLLMVDEMQVWGRPNFRELQQLPSNADSKLLDRLQYEQVNIEEFSSEKVKIIYLVKGLKDSQSNMEFAHGCLNKIKKVLRLAPNKFNKDLKNQTFYYGFQDSENPKCRFFLSIEKQKIKVGLPRGYKKKGD